MDRRGSSILLIPLLAAVALFYPARTERNQSQQTVKNGAPQKKTKAAHPLLPQLKPEETSVFLDFLSNTGPGMVADFLGVPLAGDLAQHDRRSPTQARFLFATLPDPVTSGEPYAFDRFLSSIEAALFQNRYSLSRFYLPWQDCILGSGESNPGANDDQGTEDDKKACLDERPFEYRPGIIVFTQPGPSTPILLLYLIGETPTSGIQKIALHTALDEMSWFCGDRATAYDLLGAKYEGIHSVLDSVRKVINRPDCDMVNILGPSFSGSAQSLDFALSSWRESQKNAHMRSANMVSGTAVAINPESDFRNSFAQGRFLFHSMRAPTRTSFRQLLQYLQSEEPDETKRKIALLSEAGTVTGGVVRDEAKTLTTIVFPPHISQLRAASEKHGESQQPQTTTLRTQLHELPLTQSLEEVNQRTDALPPLSQLDLASSEQALAGLLSTISRERFRYIGIQATDVRDTIFLAKEIHEHCPTTVLFLLNADLLFLHPEVNSSLLGSIVVTSYPLVNSNILWSYPHSLRMRLQFPDQGSEGVYNATLALMGYEYQMLEYGMPFDDQPSRAPIWITVVGRKQMWPLEAVYPQKDSMYVNYTYEPRLLLSQTQEGRRNLPIEETRRTAAAWLPGVHPQVTVIFMTCFMGLCVLFSLPLLSRVPRSQHSQTNGRSFRRQIANLKRACLDWAWWDRVLGPAISEKYRRGGELYLLIACASLLAFLMVALTAFLVPAFVTHHYAGVWLIHGHWYGTGLWFMVLSCGSFLVLIAGIISLLTALRTGKERGFVGSPPKLGVIGWSPTILATVTIIALSIFLSVSWISQVKNDDGMRNAFFNCLRSLDLTSGVSALLPLFLISMTGFIWATSSFHRVRMLEGAGSDRGFLCFAGLPFREVHTIEKHLRRLLQCPSFRLPASMAVLSVAGFSVLYLFRLQLVRSFESPAFYRLLGLAFFFVHLALWLGVLRFVCIWQETRKLLRHLFHTPIRVASKRYQSSFPALRKIDLATPAPSLAPLACSVDQARTLLRRAEKLASERAAREGFRVQVAVGEFEFDARRKSKSLPAPVAFDPERAAMTRLSSTELARRIQDAENALIAAREADADGHWRQVLANQLEAQEALADVTSEVSAAMQLSWWKEIHRPAKTSSEKEKSESDELYQIAEEFLAGRVAHFLGHVLPQMQNLIYTSIAGLLLMLFAVSSYPFQPHNLMLLFNWIVILSFVGTAMWVFVQMNRDPILSNLNGTTPGKITWDWEFTMRIFFYGVVPILALLGAQFPDTIGQLVSHIAPAESMHP